MVRLRKILVAAAAVAVVAFSSVTYAALWHLWRHPPRLALDQTAEGFKWRGAGYAAILTMKDRRPDRLTLWRSAED